MDSSIQKAYFADANRMENNPKYQTLHLSEQRSDSRTTLEPVRRRTFSRRSGEETSGAPSWIIFFSPSSNLSSKDSLWENTLRPSLSVSASSSDMASMESEASQGQQGLISSWMLLDELTSSSWLFSPTPRSRLEIHSTFTYFPLTDWNSFSFLREHFATQPSINQKYHLRTQKKGQFLKGHNFEKFGKLNKIGDRKVFRRILYPVSGVGEE